MASPQAQAIHAAIRESRVPYTPDIGWQQRRTGLEAMADVITVTPDGVEFSDVASSPGSPVGRWVTPVGAPAPALAGPVVLYLHGGGYVVGSARTHERMVGHIVRASGVAALLLDYRLAPEHQHPAAVDDAVAAYRWLLQRGRDPATMVVGGDSAGGGLAIALLLALTSEGLPQPAAAFAMSPWVDLACTADSMQSRSDVDLIADSTFLGFAARAYLGATEPRSPLASPLWGDLAHLPPLLVQVGDHEVLLDDSVRLVDSARALGVDATLHVFDEMQHVFQMNVGRMPEADQAIDEIAAFVTAATTGDGPRPGH